jgi:rubrerythrin
MVTVIKRIIAEQSEAILGDAARLKGFIADYASREGKAERLALGRCIEYGAYTELKTAENETARQTAKAVVARRVHANEGLDIVLCNDMLDALEAALFGERASKKSLCLKCGRELEVGWAVCPFCGAGSVAVQPKPAAPESQLVTTGSATIMRTMPPIKPKENWSKAEEIGWAKYAVVFAVAFAVVAAVVLVVAVVAGG